MAPKNPYMYEPEELQKPPSWVYDYKPFDLQDHISDQNTIERQELEQQKLEEALRLAREDEARQKAIEAEMQQSLSTQDPNQMDLDQVYNQLIPTLIKHGDVGSAINAMKAKESSDYRDLMLESRISQRQQAADERDRNRDDKVYMPTTYINPRTREPVIANSKKEEASYRSSGYMSIEDYSDMAPPGVMEEIIKRAGQPSANPMAGNGSPNPASPPQPTDYKDRDSFRAAYRQWKSNGGR